MTTPGKSKKVEKKKRKKEKKKQNKKKDSQPDDMIRGTAVVSAEPEQSITVKFYFFVNPPIACLGVFLLSASLSAFLSFLSFFFF